MSLLFQYFKIEFFENFRNRGYLVSTLIFPPLFFLIFGVPKAETPEIAAILLGSFSAFAALGVVFFQFAVAFAIEKKSPWNSYIRSLPAPKSYSMLAKTLNSYSYVLISVGLIYIVANVWTPIALAPIEQLKILFLIVLLSPPFLLMGMALGLWVNSKNALPMANLIYLPLCYAGGLWMPPQLLPDAVKKLSLFLPTRYYGEALWDMALGRSVNGQNLLYLCGFSFLFLIIIQLGHRKSLKTLSSGE